MRADHSFVFGVGWSRECEQKADRKRTQTGQELNTNANRKQTESKQTANRKRNRKQTHSERKQTASTK